MSSSDVVITGVGIVSPLGDQPSVVHQALCAGESGLRPPTLFSTEGLPARQAAEIDFDPKTYFGKANFRPLDRTGRLVTAAAQLALEDSGWSAEARKAHEVGLVLGTMFGSVHTIAAFDARAQSAGPNYAKPLDFANSVINAAAGQTAIWHDLRGINSTVAGGTAAGVQALGYATDMVRSGRADALLAGGGEELCFESYHGFFQAGLLGGSRNGAMPCTVPFDADRNGFALGEGAGLVMLESAARAASRDATVRAHIRGIGNAFDVSRGEDPARARQTLARAIGQALTDADLEAGSIDAVSVSGNGSVASDRHEALGLLDALGEHGRSVPVTAVKSLLGEGLGAGGAFQTLALIEAMRSGQFPGVHGLSRLDPELPLEGTHDSVRTIDLRIGLVTAVGLDGNNAALILESC